MAYRSPSCSWRGLLALRKRGQAPAGWVWITDNYADRAGLESQGEYALLPPEEGAELALAGLRVFMHAAGTDRSREVAARISQANPKFFAVLFGKQATQVVIA